MAEREKTLSEPLPKGRKGFYFTSSPTLTTLPLFFLMSSPSCSSLPSLFILRATPVCLFRGSRAWMSYQSFPGLWLNCEEATVSPTLCYQPHGSHNEANMHTPASTFTQIHRELKEHAHVHTCTHTHRFINHKQKSGSDWSHFHTRLGLIGHDCRDAIYKLLSPVNIDLTAYSNKMLNTFKS